MTNSTYPTREEWLLALAALLFARIIEPRTGVARPPSVKVSCGWPSKRGRRVGECWYPEHAADGAAHVFISPALDDGVEVAAIMLHELIHASMPPKTGHGAMFRKAAIACGLGGRMTATMPSDELRAELGVMVAELGPYPHGKLRLGDKAAHTQSTRMLRVVCPRCACLVRMTRSWINQAGLPTCGCGTRMVRK